MNRTVKIATAIYATSILLSRVIGLVRESVIGRTLGDQPEADVYWLAFILPDFLNYLLAGGALSLVLIPLLQSAEQRGGKEAYWACFWRIATPVSLLISMVTALLWYYTPELTPIISPGFNPNQAELLNRLTRILLPAQIFHVCGGLISATLQAHDKHLAPALAPLIYTGMIIVFGLLLGAELGAEAFAWGVLAGSVLGPFACPLLAALQNNMKLRPRLEIGHQELKSYIWRALPVMLGFSIVVLDDMLVKRGASQLAEGLVSQLHYARTLMKVPMGVFGLAMGMATFPSISRHLAQGQSTEAFKLLQKAASSLLILVGASQVLLTVASSEAVTLIWGKTRLSSEAISHIAGYCALLSLGLWAWASQGVLARGFYAQGKTWLPTVLGSILVLCFYPLYAFMGSFWAQELSDWLSRHVFEVGQGTGLALCSSLAISTYVCCLWLALCKSFGQSIQSFFTYMYLLIKIELIVGLSVMIIAYCVPVLVPTELSSLQVLMRAIVKAVLSSTIFILLCYVLQIDEVKSVVERVKQKIFKLQVKS